MIAVKLVLGFGGVALIAIAAIAMQNHDGLGELIAAWMFGGMGLCSFAYSMIRD